MSSNVSSVFIAASLTHKTKKATQLVSRFLKKQINYLIIDLATQSIQQVFADAEVFD